MSTQRSHSRGGGGFRGRGGYGSFSGGANRNFKNFKMPKSAANQLNQYYLEKFTKMKRDADLRNMQNLSMSYKRVLGALSKYPLPIICGQQTLQLEGVGDMLASKFGEMIQEREKEFEDGQFQIELLKGQNNKKISLEARQFAGLNFTENEIEGLGELSLKEYLLKKDRQVYLYNNGDADTMEACQNGSKKRKINEISKEEEDEADITGGKKKINTTKHTGSFLEVGSVSWSMLLATYFLVLHDDRKNFYITYDSIKEMLDVLKGEFGEFVPFENDPKMLTEYAINDLVKLRDNGLIEVIE